MATIVLRQIKGSALTFEEGDANIQNLNNDKLELTDLSVLTSGDGSLTYNNTTGAFTYTGPGVTEYRAAFSAGTGISIVNGSISSTVTPGIASLSEDPAPQLGGDLDVGFNSITSSFGAVGITSELNVLGAAQFGDSVSVNGIVSASAFSGDGSGLTGIATGITAVSQDITPSLGGNLNVNNQSIISTSNGNIILAPNGTGRTVTNRLNYNEAVHSLGTNSGTIAPNAANGNVQTITLNGNLTLNAFTSPVAGQSITLIVNTGGTGRTLSSTMKWAGGEKTLSTTNTTDIISIFYDGTNYWASLSKDFQ